MVQYNGEWNKDLCSTDYAYGIPETATTMVGCTCSVKGLTAVALIQGTKVTIIDPVYKFYDYLAFK